MPIRNPTLQVASVLPLSWLSHTTYEFNLMQSKAIIYSGQYILPNTCVSQSGTYYPDFPNVLEPKFNKI